MALQDKTGAGKADVIERFGETVQTGGAGGTGIGIYKGWIYAEINDRIVRYTLPAGSIVPQDPPKRSFPDLPLGGDHPMHPFVITADGSMYVDVAHGDQRLPAQEPATQIARRQPVYGTRDPWRHLAL